MPFAFSGIRGRAGARPTLPVAQILPAITRRFGRFQSRGGMPIAMPAITAGMVAGVAKQQHDRRA